MTNKFDTVTVEKDTQILFSLEATFNQYDVLYQKWSWDGILAESLIFVTDDVKHLSEDALITEIKSSPLVSEDSKPTLSQSKNGFTFVNFNFLAK